MDMATLLDWADYEALERDKWGIPTLRDDSVARRERCLGHADILKREQGREKGSDWGLDLVVMPGMGFDRGLRRLGHGKGYYDLFLQRYQQRMTLTEEEGNRKMPLLSKIILPVPTELSKTDSYPMQLDWRSRSNSYRQMRMSPQIVWTGL